MADELPPIEDSAVWRKRLDLANAEPTSLKAFDEILMIGREMLTCEACSCTATVRACGLQAMSDQDGNVSAWMECSETCPQCGSDIGYHVPPRVWAAMEMARVFDGVSMGEQALMSQMRDQK